MLEHSTEAYQILFPGPAGWELWFAKEGEAELLSSGSGEEFLDFDPSLRGTRVLAQPTARLVALLFSSHATDAQSFVESAQLHAEKEGQAIDHEGIMVEAVLGVPPKTIARIDAPLTKFNQSGRTGSLPDLIVPAATTLPLARNSVAIWCELGTLLIAFERHGRVIYYDKLSGPGPGIVDEVHRLALQLEGSHLIEKPETLLIWEELPLVTFHEGHPEGIPLETLGPFAELFRHRFEEKLQVRVEVAPRPAPLRVAGGHTLRPLWFRERQVERNAEIRKRRRVVVASIVLGIVGFVASVIFLTHYFQVRELQSQISAIRPRVDRIEAIRARWTEVATGVDPDASLLETWMNLFNLPGIASIKVEKLNISRTEISITGNAAGTSQVLGFIEELTSGEPFTGYTWEYPPPQVNAGGVATFEIKGITQP